MKKTIKSDVAIALSKKLLGKKLSSKDVILLKENGYLTSSRTEDQKKLLKLKNKLKYDLQT